MRSHLPVPSAKIDQHLVHFSPLWCTCMCDVCGFANFCHLPFSLVIWCDLYPVVRATNQPTNQPINQSIRVLIYRYKIFIFEYCSNLNSQLFHFFQDAWSVAETDADVESNAASSRPSSAHYRARQRPATAVARQAVPAAPLPRPMTAPAIDYRSQARPGTSGSSRPKSSGSRPRSRGEEERLSRPGSSAAFSPLAITNGVSQL